MESAAVVRSRVPTTVLKHFFFGGLVEDETVREADREERATAVLIYSVDAEIAPENLERLADPRDGVKPIIRDAGWCLKRVALSDVAELRCDHCRDATGLIDRPRTAILGFVPSHVVILLWLGGSPSPIVKPEDHHLTKYLFLLEMLMFFASQKQGSR